MTRPHDRARCDTGGPHVGALARLDHLDAGRQTRWSRLVGRAHLFDLAVDLDEPEMLGGGQGPLIVDTRHDRGQAPAAAVLGQGSQER